MALDPQQLAAMPEPVRRRFVRVYRTFAGGLFLGMTGITVAVLAPGRPRLLGLAALATGALIVGGALLYAFRAGYRNVPPPVAPPVDPAGGDGAAAPEPPAG